MKTVRTFTVVPALPKELKALEKIACNLWWTWNPEAVELFRRIDRKQWTAFNHNPVRFLGQISQERIAELKSNESFMNHLDRVEKELDDYMAAETWYHSSCHGEACDLSIAYFSAEFGIHECVPIYSGGLGILAGDHLKSASEIGLPFTGVGLLYKQGYFNQYLNADGWQQEEFRDNDLFAMPLMLEKDANDNPVEINVDLPDGKLYAHIWRLQVGRVPLYLLDTNLQKNPPHFRKLTAQLYGGDTDMRIRQEILLGIGGIRALRALNISFTICHMNEGHSAFLALERIRIHREEHSLSFAAAREAVRSATVFTTHTPVPAGNDRFPEEHITPYFKDFYQQLGLTHDEFMGLGRENPDDKKEYFCMTVLALNCANYSNGVSKLHGEVSRAMWKNMWPGVPVNEVPIQSITNGIHTRSWISDEMKMLFDRYLGPRWINNPVDQEIWERVYNIPDYELWRGHERLRERLVNFVRSRLKKQLLRRGASADELATAEQVLDPDALTIGFARRFATYKRATLIFEDLDRLTAILNNKNMPVQIIFAGKAHPKDAKGKEFIKKIIHLSRRPELRNKVVFLEDYDIRVARYLVQGVDVWLNNPRRPLEASGTSGMKAAANGCLNLSVLDGWWCEAYGADNGWAIGGGEEYAEADAETQDLVESRMLYDLLEREVVPSFYRKGPDGISREWLKMMKNSIATIGPVFNTNRMVRDYYYEAYQPSFEFMVRLTHNSFERANTLAQWKERLKGLWHTISVTTVKEERHGVVMLGEKFMIKAKVQLKTVKPEEVSVQICSGCIDRDGNLIDFDVTEMECGKNEGTVYEYHGEISGMHGGQNGYAIRVLPKHDDLMCPFERGMIYWE